MSVVIFAEDIVQMTVWTHDQTWPPTHGERRSDPMSESDPVCGVCVIKVVACAVLAIANVHEPVIDRNRSWRVSVISGRRCAEEPAIAVCCLSEI